MVQKNKRRQGSCPLRIAYYCHVYLGRLILYVVANTSKTYSSCWRAHIALLHLVWACDVQYFSCNKLSTIYTYNLLVILCEKDLWLFKKDHRRFVALLASLDCSKLKNSSLKSESCIYGGNTTSCLPISLCYQYILS